MNSGFRSKIWHVYYSRRDMWIPMAAVNEPCNKRKIECGRLRNKWTKWIERLFPLAAALFYTLTLSWHGVSLAATTFYDSLNKHNATDLAGELTQLLHCSCFFFVIFADGAVAVAQVLLTSTYQSRLTQHKYVICFVIIQSFNLLKCNHCALKKMLTEPDETVRPLNMNTQPFQDVLCIQQFIAATL